MVKISRDLAVVAFSVLINLISSTLFLPVFTQEIFQTDRVIIYCVLPSDLLLMEKRLHFWPTGQYFQKNYDAFGSSPYPAHLRLAAKVDGIMARVSHLLDIRPKPSLKLRVFLLKDGRQVRERYLLFQPVRQGPLLGYNPLEAFYQFGTQNSSFHWQTYTRAFWPTKWLIFSCAPAQRCRHPLKCRKDGPYMLKPTFAEQPAFVMSSQARLFYLSTLSVEPGSGIGGSYISFFRGLF